MLPEIQLIDKTNGVALGTPVLTWLAHSLSRNLISLAPYSLTATTFRAWASSVVHNFFLSSSEVFTILGLASLRSSFSIDVCDFRARSS